jgi:hypothetical protein
VSTTDFPTRIGISTDAEPSERLRHQRLHEWFSPTRANYVSRVLTAEELSVVANPADAIIIARIKRMSDDRLARFERLEPATRDDVRLYGWLQLCWLRTEEYLLGTRLGRAPTHQELFADFARNQNGLRFRAYFALKYPGRVRPCRRRTEPRDQSVAC